MRYNGCYWFPGRGDEQSNGPLARATVYHPERLERAAVSASTLLARYFRLTQKKQPGATTGVEPCGPTAAFPRGYLLVSTSAFSIVGCALHVPHSGALSQTVAKSWLE